MVSSIASQQSLDCHLRSHVSEHLYEITCAYIQGVDPMLSLLWFPDPPSSCVSYTVQEGTCYTHTLNGSYCWKAESME